MMRPTTRREERTPFVTEEHGHCSQERTPSNDEVRVLLSRL
jgi:hypothetical protein